MEEAGQEPRSRGTSLTELRHARDRGRRSDLAQHPFRPRLRFVRPDGVASPRWWNGLLYSQYQLLMLPQIERLLARVSHRLRDRHFIARLPEPDHLLAQRGSAPSQSCWPPSKPAISPRSTRAGAAD